MIVKYIKSDIILTFRGGYANTLSILFISTKNSLLVVQYTVFYELGNHRCELVFRMHSIHIFSKTSFV